MLFLFILFRLLLLPPFSPLECDLDFQFYSTVQYTVIKVSTFTLWSGFQVLHCDRVSFKQWPREEDTRCWRLAISVIRTEDNSLYLRYRELYILYMKVFVEDSLYHRYGESATLCTSLKVGSQFLNTNIVGNSKPK